MARDYKNIDALNELAIRRHNFYVISLTVFFASLLVCSLPLSSDLSAGGLALLTGLLTLASLGFGALVKGKSDWIEAERKDESERRGNREVLGMPPKRGAFREALKDARRRGKWMIDKYLVGFDLNTGEPMWVSDDDICTHAAVFAKTGVGKTLWLESIMFQQMARGRASGFTFIDAKRDMGMLADIIMMAMITGRLEDVIVVDPFDPVCSYNFVFTTQRADVKARKVLRCGLPPTSDQSTTKHYDRLAADAVYRVVRAMESLGLAWSVRDVAVALSAFHVAYPRIRSLLHERGAKQAMVELGHLAGSYRSAKGAIDTIRITDNLRGIASELHSIANSESGEMFCAPRADLSLTDAILRGKIIYYMLPRLEEAESAARMVKVFREDLEVSIGEITSNRNYHLEDPHLVVIDEGASTFGPTWANLFELSRKGRFALLFGAQSVGGLMDTTMGLSEQFFERVMANVNLKVIMRVGDNRTAMEMSEWIGKVTIEKKSFAIGQSSGISSHELTKNIEINRRAAEAYRDGINIAEDEDDLVSPEELKHEMSAEKGLAWFDLGDGRVRKGRCLWFNSDLPSSWEARDMLVQYESVEADEIGLAEWVDETILSVEEVESTRKLAKLTGAPPQATPHAGEGANSSTIETGSGKKRSNGSGEQPEDDGTGDRPYRFNMLRGLRGKPRARTFVSDTLPEKQQLGQTQHNDFSGEGVDANDTVASVTSEKPLTEATTKEPLNGSRPLNDSVEAGTKKKAAKGADNGHGSSKRKEKRKTNRAQSPKKGLRFSARGRGDTMINAEGKDTRK